VFKGAKESRDFAVSVESDCVDRERETATDCEEDQKGWSRREEKTS
jgi:hypothetical protein